MRSLLPAASTLFLLTAAAFAQQPDRSCTVQPYRGATSREGANASASMVNKGQACKFVNYGLPDERTSPAHSGRVTVQPKNGTASFEAPVAIYTPNPGFAGVDEFAYEAVATGRGNANLRMLVRVRINVAAP